MSSAAERAAAARANPKPTREEVLAEAARIFPNDVAATVMAVLDEYGGESYERERERVQRAILILAEGDLDRLRKYTQVAKRDYRDVLYWAEYPESVEAFKKALGRMSSGGTSEGTEGSPRSREESAPPPGDRRGTDIPDR